jgi:excinuclease ABC subunit C
VEIFPPITIPLWESEASEPAAPIPKGPGVYAFRAGKEIVHLSWSAQLNTRIVRLLSRTNAANGTLGSRMKEAGFVLHCWPTASRLESSIVMYEVLRSEGLADYRKRLRLRLPWFVTLTTRDPFPRLSVVNRIPSGNEPVFGPFQFRDGAQRYADNVLGCFQIRKCTDVLIPDPSHPGCLYGEIKQCLRPCQKAVTEADYVAEVQRVYSFLLTNGDTDLRGLSKARDEAARALQFEKAADLHKSIAKVKEIGRLRDELVCDARSLSGIALTKGAGANSFRLWPMLNGLWREPTQITVEEDATPESIGEKLQGSVPALISDELEVAGDAVDHLAILARWYHSSWRDGHWYPLRSGAKPSVRRISKAALRMLREDANQ